MRRVYKHIISLNTKWLQHGAVLISLFAGVIYATLVVSKFDKDTTSITNAAFVIVSVLAGLSFGMASAILEGQLKDRFLYAGERFFHAAILLILASILKYAAFAVGAAPFLQTRKVLSNILILPLNLLVQACFMWAVLTAHTGFKIANKQLWSRMGRAKDWDDIV